MTNQSIAPPDITPRDEVREWPNRLTILSTAHSGEWANVLQALRGIGLQKIFKRLGRGPHFGNSTTHMAKLRPRLDGGSGGGCPVVVFGISEACYVED
jgi:hypothetical protein